jgi:hypothetical protein
MKNKPALALLFFLSALLIPGCATPGSREVTFRVGDTQVRALVVQQGAATPTMINVHDNENTSVLAGRRVLSEASGRLIELSHSGHRLVTFQLGGLTYRFDPNRIFSDAGIRETLTRRGAYSAAGHQVVAQFARDLLDRFALNREPVIIALHNTDGRGLTIHSYRGDEPLSSASARVQVSQTRRPGDFFYVTDRRFFDYLAARDFNVTLQHDANVPDDGSLSVYCARLDIPYVNVEADNTHLAEQTEMVRVVLNMIRELGLAPNPRQD